MADVVPISDRVRSAREALLQAHLDAQNAGDIEGVLATFSTPRLELIPSGRVFDGEDAMRAHLAERFRSFSGQHFEMVSIHHSDRAVVSEFWMTATHDREFNGIEATGRRFRVRVASFFELDDDGITCQRLYYDAGTIARQLA